MNQEIEFIKPIPIKKEVAWDKTKIIMSKTDLYGTIEYVNEVFTDVSGYEDCELISKPHNIIRHPDMPQIIYKILWDNIKQGNQFHGIIKNLAKSGRYYWAITDFEYVMDENNNVIKYIARRKAVPQDVITKHIEPLYRRLLQIEQVSGVDASENYLIGFLEESGVNYVDLITNLMIDDDKAGQLQGMKGKGLEANGEDSKEKRQGFFSKFFSKN
ncbi:PAS domain-containing protein [Flavobacterium psychrophilum]|uniref:PAS domain-containing protein n=1 Tax=Flavobacterium psychrophilum TaxID=96345 RepID=UPI00106C90E5|nr:PAS domain-containing protein [Flavobacterium psychrophilum]